jgi:5-(hydroxymethyl)furfural/furfural oxidase
VPDTKFDYVIVGAGAAGCVLASRLSSNPATKVLLLEAGPDQPPGHEHAAIRDPYPVSLGHGCFSWPDLVAEVGPDLQDGKPRFSRHYLQGFGVGGGSNIQGMVALRGLPQDYDEWLEAGAAGWGWDDVLPYFRRLERDLDFDGALHGQDGPIPIRRIKPEQWAPFAKAFADCAQARGYPLVEDFNADFRAGVGPLPMANLPGQRVSACMGYLNEAVRRRSNLTILANSHVERIELEGRKSIGVVTRTAGGKEFFAAGEVILSAGALHSPAILMRSGIGPGQHLMQQGIEVKWDLPGVGQHLMNHVGGGIATYLRRHAVQPNSQRGYGQSCLHFSSGLEDSENDILIVAINKTSWHALGRRIGALGMEVHKIHSLGEVRLRSADPAVTPEVKFNLLSDERDLIRLLIGLKLCLEILADERMAQVTNEVFVPNRKRVKALSERNAWNWIRASTIRFFFEAGPLRRPLLGFRLDPNGLLRDPTALRQWALQYVTLPHHVSSTCRMGHASDKAAVVDSECRVFGVQNLRVVDASVMPTLVRATTHIPVLMIAEKMADTISSDQRRRS